MAEISSKSHLMFQFLAALFLSCLISMPCFDAAHQFLAVNADFPYCVCSNRERKICWCPIKKKNKIQI